MYVEHMPIRLVAGNKFPVKGEKVSAGNTDRCSESLWLNHDGNFGIRTGEVSNGFEVIDFDPKNFGEESNDREEILRRSKDLMKQYKELLYEQEGGLDLMGKLVLVQTPSGGYHFYFRSNHCEGNMKLAKNPDNGGFIETRGDGGLVATIPTEGYDVKKGSIFEVPKISDNERDLLLDTARAFNQYFDDKNHKEEYKQEDRNSDSPFVAANLDSSAFLIQLESDGWEVVGKRGDDTLLRRSGKSKGHSAIFNDNPRTGKYAFIWNFSSSSELESEKRFNYCAYLLEMEFGGDKRRLAETLIHRGYGKDKLRSKPQAQHIVKDLSEDDEGFWGEIQPYFVDQDTEVPEEPPVIWMKDQLFLTVGNLAGVAGIQKTGKSALANVIMSKMLNPSITDFPSIKVLPPNGKGVLLVDTEQSRTKQKSNVVSWILKRAGVSALPKNFRVVNFRSFSTIQSKDYLSQIMKAMKQRYNGLHLVIVDGGADFVSTVNNLEEVTAFMKLLSELCTVYDCGILLNIHTNPSSSHTGDHKPTGHLGSALLKKCESVALIQTDEYDKTVSLVTALALRNGNRDEFGEVFYKYDKEKGYHMEIIGEAAVEKKEDNKHLNLLKKVAELCKGSELSDGMLDCMKEFDWSADQAKKKIKECLKLKYLVVDGSILKLKANFDKNDQGSPSGAPF